VWSAAQLIATPELQFDGKMRAIYQQFQAAPHIRATPYVLQKVR
jgi:hypothetical protein